MAGTLSAVLRRIKDDLAAFLPDAATAMEMGGSWRPVQTVVVLAVWAFAGGLVTPRVLRRMAGRQSGAAMQTAREQAAQRVELLALVECRLHLLERGHVGADADAPAVRGGMDAEEHDAPVGKLDLHRLAVGEVVARRLAHRALELVDVPEDHVRDRERRRGHAHHQQHLPQVEAAERAGHPEQHEHRDHVELPITGMTCASCANRIERKLNKLDGVSATVNYATEKATVDYDPGAARPEDLLGAVEAAGYQAVLPTAEPTDSFIPSGSQSIWSMIRVVESSMRWNVTTPAFVLPSVARQATRGGSPTRSDCARFARARRSGGSSRSTCGTSGRSSCCSRSRWRS